jgi:hypothetical protein
MSTTDPAGVYDFVVHKGEAFRRTITVSNTDTDPAVVKDWTGYTGLCQVRAAAGNSVVLATATVSFNAPRTDGEFHLELTSESIFALPDGEVVYDVRMTKTGEDPYYPIKGTITVSTRVSIPS